MLPVILMLVDVLSGTLADYVPLTTVSENIFTQHLYRRLRNEYPPSASDPALADAAVRKKYCDDITGSGLFEIYYHWRPVDERKVYLKLKKPRHAHIFRQLYSPRRNLVDRLLSRRQKYTNEFVQQTFTVNNSFAAQDPINTNEYVFMCLLKDSHSDLIQSLYVSKEYNLNGGNNAQPFKAGRFVFDKRRGTENMDVRLAEESAVDYKPAGPDFNIELYYLGIRSHRQPAENPDQDPICPLASTDREHNQLTRLCTAVLTTEFFKSYTKYPMQLTIPGCEKKRVAFLTEDAAQKAAGTRYYENMVSCLALNHSGFPRTYHISRAYTTHQVFVYELDIVDNKIYLKNLSINLGFVLEPAVFNFDDVE